MKSRGFGSRLRLFSTIGLLGIFPQCDMPWRDKTKTPSVIEDQTQAAKSGAVLHVAPGDSSTVLATLGGKPMVTSAQVNEQVEAEPRLKEMRPMLGEACIDGQVLQALIQKAVVSEWAHEKNLASKPDYAAERARMIDSIEYILNTRHLANDLSVAVTEAEIKAFYEANKTNPQLMVSRGGVKAACVSFDKEEDAKAFVSKVESYKGDVKRAAQELKALDKFKDFALIHAQSVGIDPALREQIIGMEKVPTTKVCKVSDALWYVVRATGKEEPKYVPFETVKGKIRESLESKKRMEELDRKLTELKAKYGVSLTESGDKLNKAAEECMRKFQQQAPAEGELAQRTNK